MKLQNGTIFIFFFNLIAYGYVQLPTEDRRKQLDLISQVSSEKTKLFFSSVFIYVYTVAGVQIKLN